MLDDSVLKRLFNVSQYVVGSKSRQNGFFENLIKIIVKSSNQVEFDDDLIVSAGELKDAASDLINGALKLLSTLEKGGSFTGDGKRLSRFTGKNDRVEADKEISDILRNRIRKSSDKLLVLRELECPDMKLRIICRILSERLVRVLSCEMLLTDIDPIL